MDRANNEAGRSYYRRRRIRRIKHLGTYSRKRGIVADLSILEAVAYENKPLYQIVEDVKNEIGIHYINHRIDLHVTEEVKEKTLKTFINNPPKEVGGLKVKEMNTIDGFKFYFEDNNSWMLVRASGTEPIFRIYFETDSQDKLEKMIKDIGTFVSNI
jgi:phosphomannomutase